MERPKRRVTSRCLEYNNGMLPEEELALRRALQASLQTSNKTVTNIVKTRQKKSELGSDSKSKKDEKKSEKKNENKMTSKNEETKNKDGKRKLNNGKGTKIVKKQKRLLVQVTNPRTFRKKSGLLAAKIQKGKVFKNKKKQKEILVEKKVIRKNRRKFTNRAEAATKPDESNSPSVAHYAQRKFAQTNPNSPRSLLLYQNQKQPLKTRAKTEDFLDFLCLRGSDRLPKALELFNNPCAPVSPLTDEEEQNNKSSETSSPVPKIMEPSAKRSLIMPSNDELQTSSSSSSPSSLVCPPVSTRIQPHAVLPQFTNAKTNYGVLTHTPIPYPPLTGTPQCPPRQQGFDAYGLPFNDSCFTSYHPCVSSVAMGTHKPPSCSQGEKQGFHLVNTNFPSSCEMTDPNMELNSQTKSNQTPKKRTPIKTSAKTPENTTKSPKSKKEEATNTVDRDKDTELSDLDVVPTFSPTEQEFKNPFRYIEAISPKAEQFGMCVIVPPESWKPEFCLAEDIRFTTKLQDIHRLSNNMPDVEVELAAIRKHLEQQNIPLIIMPQIAGCELDLVHISKVIKEFGGLQQVIDKRKWGKVADALKIPRTAVERTGKLEQIYYKYLLSYDLLHEDEKEELLKTVKNDINSPDFPSKTREHISKGRSMALSLFQRTAKNNKEHHLKTNHNASVQEIEKTYWRIVDEGQHYVVVHASQFPGTGFPTAKAAPFSKSKWNLNVLPKTVGCIGRDLNDIEGISFPLINVGMMFSTNTWTVPPHALYTLEYLHQGTDKIWYSIPASSRVKMLEIASRQCEDLKVQMISPLSLHNAGIDVYRSIQAPRQFILKFPNASHSSISCGYTLSESVSFSSWLHLNQLKASFMLFSMKPKCKSVFCWENLIISSLKEELKRNNNAETLNILVPELEEIISYEVQMRNELTQLRVLEKQTNDDEDGEASNCFDEEMVNCSVCDKLCYISWVVDKSEKFYCSEHAINTKHVIDMLEQEETPDTNMVLETQYDVNHLDELLKKGREKIIEAQYKPKTSKRKVKTAVLQDAETYDNVC